MPMVTGQTGVLGDAIDLTRLALRLSQPHPTEVQRFAGPELTDTMLEEASRLFDENHYLWFN